MILRDGAEACTLSRVDARVEWISTGYMNHIECRHASYMPYRSVARNLSRFLHAAHKGTSYV